MSKVTDVLAMEFQGGSGLAREGSASPGARLSPTLDPPIQLAKHGSEAAKGAVEGGELLAQIANIPGNLISLTLGHVSS